MLAQWKQNRWIVIIIHELDDWHLCAVASIFCASCHCNHCWHCYQFEANKATVCECVCYQKCINISASCQYQLLLPFLLFFTSHSYCYYYCHWTMVNVIDRLTHMHFMFRCIYTALCIFSSRKLIYYCCATQPLTRIHVVHFISCVDFFSHVRCT